MRKTKFANNEYYHIFNRGVDKREIFSNKKDFTRFLKIMADFNAVESLGGVYRASQIKHTNNRRGLASTMWIAIFR